MFEETVKILKDQLHLKDDVVVTLDSKIKDDLGADSLDILQLLMTIEEEHGIVIPDEELAKFVTVKDIVTYLENNK